LSFIVFVSVGLGLIAGGIYWHVWDETTYYLDNFVVAGAYSELIQLFWDMIPVIMLLLGVLCLIMAGRLRGQRGG